MRWCGGCAKAHKGAVDKRSKKCEDCKAKTPSYGMPEEGKAARWCSGCGKAGHPGSVAKKAKVRPGPPAVNRP